MSTEPIYVQARYNISAIVNLNHSVITDNSGNLGLKASTISSTSEAVTNYNLPTGSAEVSCGTITTTGIGVTISGDGLIGKISVNVDSSGNMSSNVIINGNGFVATANDDPNNAQYVYWTGENTSQLTATSPDSLTASYTNETYTNLFANLIADIESVYSGNMIQSWTFHIPRIEPSANSAIYVYAETYNRFDASGNLINNVVFNNGDEIVLRTAYPYSVSITDIDNQLVTIIPSTDIYAKLKHDNSGVTMDEIV